MIEKTTADSKARYWVAVCYPENMREDWQDVIDELLQVPYVYCVHDKDTTSKDEEDRKVHVHIMIAFSNTTTYKNALSIFKTLNAEGKDAVPTCQKVNNVRWMYDYLIHDTENAKKKNKHQYDPAERISGNNFDIGAYEQISEADKKVMRREVREIIKSECITNFMDLMEYVDCFMGSEYEDLVYCQSAFFERLTRGMYLKCREEGTSFIATTTINDVTCDGRQKTLKEGKKNETT